MNNILVIGQGGREHAIAWKLSQSKLVKHVFVLPGNDGMISSKISIQNIDSTNFQEVIQFAKKENIYYTIVGPEVELSLGIVDAFEKEGLRIFGPNKYAAQLESSKSFCKEKMQEFNIPTSSYEKFTNINKAVTYIKNASFPIVIKADGLAAGKGVSICNNFTDAQKVIHQYLGERKFGNASKDIIIEEYLEGPEFSQLAFVNDDKISYMKIAQDYKRAFDNDKGENTGGMGCHMPVNLSKESINEGYNIINKMVMGMKASGHPFKGILYAGLMDTKDGVKVIEFNVRFGDPETELILSSMESDLFLIIDNMLNKDIIKIKWSNKHYVGVVLASKGYPDAYAKNIPLPNLDTTSQIFYMGVKKNNNHLVSNGGRVLISVGSGDTMHDAKKQAYSAFDNLNTKDFFYRTDISN